MKVRKIRNGTVIDHIPTGRAFPILKILGIDGSEGSTLLVATNMSSGRHGRKDVIKLEDVDLDSSVIAKIALIAPKATINKISDYKVVNKNNIKLPEVVEGTVNCTNPNCVSAQEREPIIPKFSVISEGPLRLKCVYCPRIIEEEEISKQLVGSTA
jgi:aspartate carbamoyltransferase regulatory subunit